MKVSNAVLVVSDVQNGFINDHSHHVIPKIRSLIEQCKEVGVPVILTKFINAENSPFKRLLGWSDVTHSPETDLYEAISTPDALVIEKYFYTALTDEFLRSAASKGWKTVIICGFSTESCVLKTAVDAFENGFEPFVIIDACASNLGVVMHIKGLDVLEVLIGHNQLITSEQFFAAMNASL